ncbi:PrgI family mobile element protein [Thermaerobacter litoralis]
MDATRAYPVPLDLRRDEHAVNLFGLFPITFRQLAYVVGGLAPGIVAAWLANGVWQWLLGTLLWLLLLPPAFALAIFPAGWGPLPGPRDRYSSVQEEPLRLDEWLLIYWDWRRCRKVLPFPWRRSPKGAEGGRR